MGVKRDWLARKKILKKKKKKTQKNYRNQTVTTLGLRSSVGRAGSGVLP